VSGAFPLPELDWEPTRGFWEAAARHELAVPRCRGCGAWCWYPPERCPKCGSDDLPWTPVSGRASLFSWAIVRRALVAPFATRVPYVTGLVTLDEDPAVRLVTDIVDCDPDALRAGDPVRVVFRTLSFPDVEGEVSAPMFAPASPAG
jgi:uncharacterized OB-fold protein